MHKLASFLLFFGFLAGFSGCGGDSSPAAVAEQDEISKYVSENPELVAPSSEGIK
jgi:hypothetical protein